MLPVYSVNKSIMLKGIRILVAEDDRLNQKVMAFILQKQGAEVKMAANGHEAIELLSGNNFDIILMDLQMPGMNGYETAKYIRTNLRQEIPIIALTADLVANVTAEYKEAGMNACISKPVQANELCKLILNLAPQFALEK